MRFYVGITDQDWFAQLASRAPLDEVNFWQPSGKRQFRALDPGEPFLFKLHSPDDYIVGGGFFGHHSILPVSLAWAAFEGKNGAKTQDEMRARIARYRRTQPDAKEDYSVGCILLESPFFFGREDWIPLLEWRKPVVQGQGFDSSTEPGGSVWKRVEVLLRANGVADKLPEVLEDSSERRFGAPQIVLPRLGQGSFRIVVTDAYRRRCAVTGSPVLHVLEAAHVKPYARGGTHEVSNGVLLRQDYHTLLDHGYITVTTDFKIEVSRRIREEFDNGKEYYAVHGKELVLPSRPEFRPDPGALRWHNESVYLG